ncbi:hypothetical protein [Yoonia sp.]|uniref:hypothetical protein n=1 Tax=Yoonia sp. TaxID=2212373 RepID=UPI0025D296F2|nr:hypothetical protein [Yoonia sp.]
MSDRITALIDRIQALEDELETEFEQKHAALNLRIEHGRAVFDKEVERQQAALRTGLLKYVTGSRPLIVLTSPVIYGVVIPFVLLDLCVTLYQLICFPVYGIAKVRRKDHIVFDRHHLHYLNWLEKLNCAYCSYGNGLLSYACEIASRTEQYWCPIKHARRIANTHRHYRQFAEYGDAEGYRNLVDALDKRLKNLR